MQRNEPTTFCSSGTSEGLISDAISRFNGRLLSEDDSATPESTFRIMGDTAEQVIIRDMSRVIDRIRAIKYGIRNMPTVVVNGEKYMNIEDILKVFSTIEQKRNEGVFRRLSFRPVQ